MPRIPEIRPQHLYVPEPGYWPTKDIPCTCGHPRAWRGHDVPDTPVEAAEIDARVLGESTE